MEESLVKVKIRRPTTDESCIYKGNIIEPSKESGPQKVILEKPIVEMTKTHSMSNLQGELHQRLLNGKYLKQYFSTMWERLGITQRIRPILRLIRLNKPKAKIMLKAGGNCYILCFE